MKNRKRLLVFVILNGVTTLALLQLMAIPALGQPPAASRPDLSGSWNTNAIIAALQWRESELANCTYKMKEQLWMTHHDDITDKLFQTDEFEVRAADHTIWVSGTSDNARVPDASVPFRIDVWDGANHKFTTSTKAADGKDGLIGVIDNRKPQFLGAGSMDVSFLMVGLNWGFGDPWSKSIQTMLAMEGTSSAIEEKDIGGEKQVILILLLKSHDEQDRFVFLPEKDFVFSEVTRTIAIRRDSNAANSTGKDTFHATKFAKFDDFWMPTEAEYSTGEGVSPAKPHGTWSLESFTTRVPSPEELDLEFKSGTQVMDAVNHQLYRLNPDGSKTYSRFFDATAGAMVEPPTQPSTRHD